MIERAEKQIILAKHGQRLLALLDDSPITPGDARRVYEQGGAARQVLNDAEDDLKTWETNRGQDLVGNEATEFGTSGGVPRGGGEVSAESHAAGTSTDQTADAGNEGFATASSSPARSARPEQ